MSLVRDFLAQHGADPDVAAVAPALQECVVLLRGPGAAGKRSHLGGTPRLPAAAPWPRTGGGRPLSLLAEIWLDEVPSFDGRELLPEGGVLAFWFDCEWMPDFSDGAGHRVTWHPGTDLPDDAWGSTFPPDLGLAQRFRQVPVAAVPHVSAPAADHMVQASPSVLRGRDPDAYETLDFLDEFASSLQVKAAEAVLGRSIPHGPDGDPDPDAAADRSSAAFGVPHQMLGHQRTLQSEPYDPDWELLLQLDSDAAADGPGWMFGDTGILWFFIRRTDLAARRFERAKTLWSCC